jgi:hypothetical protein
VRKWERPLAVTVLANAGIGMAATLADIAASPAIAGMLWFSLLVAALGLAAGISMVRGSTAGFVGGMLVGGPQIFSYFPYGGVWNFNVRPGISLCLTTYLHSGVLLVNAVGIVLAAGSALILVNRLRADAQIDL